MRQSILETAAAASPGTRPGRPGGGFATVYDSFQSKHGNKICPVQSKNFVGIVQILPNKSFRMWVFGILSFEVRAFSPYLHVT
jgi:hypothetical protein